MSTKKKEAEEKKEKVFCEECLHPRRNFMWVCAHPVNRIEDPITRDYVKGQYCEIINRNNDCPHFEARPKPKAFCDNCEYFDTKAPNNPLIAIWPDPRCTAEENRVDGPYRPKQYLQHLPANINKNNDCKYFKAKPKPGIIAMIEPTPRPSSGHREWATNCMFLHKWKEVKNTGKWSYRICTKCGLRKIVEIEWAGYQPIDNDFLKTR